MPSNHEYHAEIARILVADGGWREALDFCRENDWQGVLQAIQATVDGEPLLLRPG